MPLYRKSAGANVALTLRRRASSAWVTLGFLRRRLSGAWTDLIAFTISPTSSYRSAFRGATISQNFTASGVGSCTWSWLSGGTGIAISNASSLTCTLSSSTGAGAAAIVRSGWLRCTSGGQTRDAYVEWTWEGNA